MPTIMTDPERADGHDPPGVPDRHETPPRTAGDRHGVPRARAVRDQRAPATECSPCSPDRPRRQGCARTVPALATRNINIRAGMHPGECERRGDDWSGVGVHIGARVAALAESGGRVRRPDRSTFSRSPTSPLMTEAPTTSKACPKNGDSSASAESEASSHITLPKIPATPANVVDGGDHTGTLRPCHRDLRPCHRDFAAMSPGLCGI